MEKLQMLKYGIRKDTKLNFTEGMSWKEELMEIEAAQKDVIPTDMYSYIKSLDVVENDEDEDGSEDEESSDEESSDEESSDEGEEEEEEGEEEEEEEEDEEDMYD
jgi:hypothetical protein